MKIQKFMAVLMASVITACALPTVEAEIFLTKNNGIIKADESDTLSDAAKDFGYQLNEQQDGIIINSYFGNASDVYIPTEIDGIPVTEISDFSFTNNFSVTSLHIPYTVLNIGIGAFYCTSSLAEFFVDENNEHYCSENGVLFNKEKTEIIQYPCAKEDKTYSIPKTVTIIRQYVFSYCSNITEVNIPASVSMIETLWDHSGQLYAINVDKDNESFSSDDGILFSKDKTALIRCPEGKIITDYVVPDYVTKIHLCAFQYNPSIVSVTMSDSVVEIGSNALYDCGSLETVRFSDNITDIPEQCCTWSSNLKTVNIPKLAKSIGYRAFACTSVREITISESIETIGEGALSDCYNINVDPKNKYYSSIEGVLYNKDGTVLIQFPASRGGDFVVPSGVKKIREQAFQNNYRLTSVVFPEGLTAIEDFAFAYCTELKSISLPKSVNLISKDAFMFCELENINGIDGSNAEKFAKAYGTCFNGVAPNVFFDPDNTQPVHQVVVKSYDGGIPEGAELKVTYDESRIDKGIIVYKISCLLNGKEIQPSQPITIDIEYPSVTWVGRIYSVDDEGNYTDVDPLFIGAYTSVEIGMDFSRSVFTTDHFGEFAILTNDNSPIEVPQYEFEKDGYSCTYGEYVNSLQITKYSGDEENVVIPSYIDGKVITRINDEAFAGNEYIKSITVPDTVVVIDTGVFSNCVNLESAVWPANGLPIGVDAFKGCISLKTIEIPNTVKSIMASAFAECESLSNITLPEGLLEIGSEAFINCVSLSSIKIPSSVKQIGDPLANYSVFSRCYNLNEILVDENNENFMSIDGVLYSKDKTEIIQCPIKKELKNYELPKETLYIGKDAFGFNESLEKISATNITSIGNFAFSQCVSLAEINGMENVTHIGSYAFFDCEKIKSIEIPDNITTIDVSTFESCSSLTAIEISENVTSIEYNAFRFCDSLVSVTIPDSVQYISDSAFLDNSEYLTIYANTGSYAESYAKAYNINFVALDKTEILVDSSTGISVADEDNIEGKELVAEMSSYTDTSITYNITLTDENGEVIQPESPVTVSIPLPAMCNNSEAYVYRKEANGEYTDMKAEIKEGMLVFVTDHFSEYIVTTEELVTIKLGDLDGNGMVNVVDALTTLKAATGKLTLTDEQMTAADVNDDGNVNIVDALTILKMATGKI